MKMIVLGRDANGAPAFFNCDLANVTKAQAEDGSHYDRAVELAAEAGFDSPFEVFDERDPAAMRLSELGKWLRGDPYGSIREELATVIDMATSHIDDIESGLDDGTYDASENTDAPQKRHAVEMITEAFRSGVLAQDVESRYLIVVEGDVDPSLVGPFDTGDAVLKEARRQRQDDPDMENGLFRLRICNGEPEIGSFSGQELDADVEEEEHQS